MNTRLQVEHPVTEVVTGIDLVEQQLLIAAGEPPSFDPGAAAPRGPRHRVAGVRRGPGALPARPGRDHPWQEPTGPGVRVDSGYVAGNTVTPFYDPLLAKLVVHGPDRPTALGRAAEAVRGFAVEGPKSNLPFLAEVLADQGFVRGPLRHRAGGPAARSSDPRASLGCRLTAPRQGAGRPREPQVAEELRAEMVANVWKVVAAVGDQVADGRHRS